MKRLSPTALLCCQAALQCDLIDAYAHRGEVLYADGTTGYQAGDPQRARRHREVLALIRVQLRGEGT